MRKLFSAALLLSIASLASAEVTTAPSGNWETHRKIEELTAKIASLQADIVKLQTDNDDLKAKLAKTEAQLEEITAKAGAMLPTTINPAELLKDYPADKFPAPGEPSNPLRIHAINDYLAKQWANKPVTIAGSFLKSSVATERSFTIRIGPPLVPPAPATAMHWFVDAALPTAATDDILRLKKSDPVTITGILLRAAYTTSDGKTALLTLTLKDCSLAK